MLQRYFVRLVGNRNGRKKMRGSEFESQLQVKSRM